MISGGQQSGGGVSTPQTTKCDCIPERAYSVDLTSNIFKVENVTSPIGNFTYNLKFKPNAQYSSISNSWNSYINSSFGLSNRKGCRIIHQYILYEYTDGSGGFQETFLEEFWSSPNYTPHSGNQFNTALKSNKK